MRREEVLTVVLVMTGLVTAGCGYGPEEPRKRAAAPSARPPATRSAVPAPELEPAPPAEPPRSTGTQPEPPPPEAVPTAVTYVPPDPGIISGYIGGALGGLRQADAMAQLGPVNQWLKTYELLNGKFPKDMRELVRLYKHDGGVLRRVSGWHKYFYWPKEGVVKLVRVEDPRFADPQGLHTMPPEP